MANGAARPPHTLDFCSACAEGWVTWPYRGTFSAMGRELYRNWADPVEESVAPINLHARL